MRYHVIAGPERVAKAMPCRAMPAGVGYHAVMRYHAVWDTLPSGALGACAALCCRLDGLEIRSAPVGSHPPPTAMRNAYSISAADSLRACLPIWQGGAAAAVMVAGSPNVTAVYEVGTRAQQVLETVSSALSRAPPRPQWACACASVYEAPGLARTCYAHSFVIMSTAHGTRRVRGCVLSAYGRGSSSCRGGRTALGQLDTLWSTQQGPAGPELRRPVRSDSGRRKKGYLGIAHAVEAALAGGRRTLCRVSPPGVGLAP